MHAFTIKLGTLALSLFVLASSGAHAAGSLFRTYLSINGNDANPCTVQLPCRLLPAALAQTADQGEVWMLDSANYNTGAVTIRPREIGTNGHRTVTSEIVQKCLKLEVQVSV